MNCNKDTFDMIENIGFMICNKDIFDMIENIGFMVCNKDIFDMIDMIENISFFIYGTMYFTK